VDKQLHTISEIVQIAVEVVSGSWCLVFKCVVESAHAYKTDPYRTGLPKDQSNKEQYVSFLVQLHIPDLRLFSPLTSNLDREDEGLVYFPISTTSPLIVGAVSVPVQ
jgi:hypothetical protein